MSLCLSPVRLSTRYELCFPWILSNPNQKFSPILLAVHHSNTLPRIFTVRVVQQGGDVVVSPEEVSLRISEVKARSDVVEEVSVGFAAADSGFEDNVPISSTRAARKIGADDRLKLGYRKKVRFTYFIFSSVNFRVWGLLNGKLKRFRSFIVLFLLNCLCFLGIL